MSKNKSLDILKVMLDKTVLRSGSLKLLEVIGVSWAELVKAG